MLYERNGRGERAVARIDLGRVRDNTAKIKASLSDGTKLIAVVKANAYGHGAFPCAKAALEGGADMLAVATMREGMELRREGITEDIDIIILGHTPPDEAALAIFNNFTLTVFSLADAAAISKRCVQVGASAKVHIKVDSGMFRLGFLPNDESVAEILELSRLPCIKIDGIFSHFSSSGEYDKSYTLRQLEVFTDFAERLEAAGLSFPMKHISNSAAILDVRAADFQAVRAGIILYGLRPSEDSHFDRLALEPALSWRSYVSFVKEIPAGSAVGYGRAFVTERTTKIATIPIGYADGFLRGRSGGHVLIDGQFAKIIGNICMDQFMADVTDIPGVKAYDEVVLIGRQGGRELSADYWAALEGTINYEIVCDISNRVQRQYVPLETP